LPFGKLRFLFLFGVRLASYRIRRGRDTCPGRLRRGPDRVAQRSGRNSHEQGYPILVLRPPRLALQGNNRGQQGPDLDAFTAGCHRPPPSCSKPRRGRKEEEMNIAGLRRRDPCRRPVLLAQPMSWPVEDEISSLNVDEIEGESNPRRAPTVRRGGGFLRGRAPRDRGPDFRT